MIMKKLKFKIKKWFFNTFIKRYLATVDNKLLGLFTWEAKKHIVSFGDERVNRERKRIMNILSSKKYKEYFFKAVRYNRNKPEVDVIKPFGINLLDRISKVISVGYLYLFDRNLYISVQLYNRWKNKISGLDNSVDDYIKNTSVDEREDRAILLGILDKNKTTSQKRMRNIQNIRVNYILEHNEM